MSLAMPFWEARQCLTYAEEVRNLGIKRKAIKLELTSTKPERTMREFLSAIFWIIGIVTFLMLLHGMGLL
jgi:hypothetical protein